ncbi:unnamed protein product [Rotaria sordida]|uniref:Uncharacterized protein n=1 Tax=Rotaria sordida TaxID=392033 RepID=A0A818LCL8_9BILA|nr:unnamed protein product [Rotaria sordida]CAF0864639.1 unnamed protein product [Rotaria sordida]CAF0874380.1 unnamed protein product [Rotaria sordida]CAF1245908.1 unnamed protein product [Rotaria sordida]CAF3564120.1 unnamed protein product [Rotaria sordida]
MVTENVDSADKTSSTAIIVTIVIMSVLCLIFLIVCIVAIIYLIKRYNQSGNVMRGGQVLQLYPSNVPKDSSEYPPPYSTLNLFHSLSAPEFTELRIP